MHPEALWEWVKRAETDEGIVPGTTSLKVDQGLFGQGRQRVLVQHRERGQRGSRVEAGRSDGGFAPDSPRLSAMLRDIQAPH